MKTSASANYGLLLSGLAMVSAAAAIAAGVYYLIAPPTAPADELPDTTARLLSGGNWVHILAALARDKNRQFVAHDLL